MELVPPPAPYGHGRGGHGGGGGGGGVTIKVVNALGRNYGTDTIEMGGSPRAQIR